ncbi:hypothetical protein [Ramlibacter alkalitolerans]|uniref:Uncharacterized protein n=1 Tax=Ramlibacter alkalitolerans TaxID=2039631 RepID=A0ABS1JQI1_9BURK|nr:hypothetical protein [Ramlibacter alkalitolerans]MBL0426515.1 hypothetical protein [Ramlibacter alkalitolerans]
MRMPAPRLPLRSRLASALVLACAASLLQAASFPLEIPGQRLTVEVSDELEASPVPGTPDLTAYLAFPSGQPLAAPSWLSQTDSVRIVLRPLAPGMPTRVEALLDRALPTESDHASGRPWFVRRTDDGMAVYRQATQETWIFRGRDGARVGVHVPTTPIQRTHLASRRYGDSLEVIYQYGREHADLRAMDAFVLAQLRKHVRSVVRETR